MYSVHKELPASAVKSGQVIADSRRRFCVEAGGSADRATRVYDHPAVRALEINVQDSGAGLEGGLVNERPHRQLHKASVNASSCDRAPCNTYPIRSNSHMGWFLSSDDSEGSSAHRFVEGMAARKFPQCVVSRVVYEANGA